MNSTEKELDFDYTVCDDHIEIRMCRGIYSSVEIPSEIEGLPVTTIKENAFYNMRSLMEREYVQHMPQ